MRRPNPRLASLGLGRESVSVYSTGWGRDEDGGPVKVPVGPPRSHPAVVTRRPAVSTEADGTTESISGYQVMILADLDPGIVVGDVLTWTCPWPGSPRPRDLVAAGPAINAGPGAWALAAAEVGPDPDPDADAGPFDPT